jgi:hypothetical protein
VRNLKSLRYHGPVFKGPDATAGKHKRYPPSNNLDFKRQSRYRRRMQRVQDLGSALSGAIYSQTRVIV